MAKQKIITFSGQAQHGKDTSVQVIKQIIEANGYKAIKINYADYLKYIAMQYLGWDGIKNERGRSILQVIGTEKVRSRFPDFWVDAAINIAKIFENNYDYVLIGDCRFPNEIGRWKEEGYSVITVHIERLNFDNGLTVEQKRHPSETALNDYDFDIRIKAENLEDLEYQIRVYLEDLV